MGESDCHKPGQLVRPKSLNKEEIADTVSRVYGLTVTSFTELPSYDDRNYHVIVIDSRNGYIERVLPEGYVFKVLNKVESKKIEHVEAMNALLQHLDKHDIRTSVSQYNLNGDFFSLERFEQGGETEDCVVRLFNFIPGTILPSVPYTPALIYSVGRYVGRIDRALKSFNHPFYDTYDTIWNLMNVAKLKDYLHVIENIEDRQIVDDVIKAFAAEVEPLYDKLTSGIIHGDVNEQNVLVDKVNGQYDVVAVIDIGDAHKSYTVFELGISIAYIMMDSAIVDCLDVGGYMLAGYLKGVVLSKHERDVLKTVVAARFAQSLVFGAVAYSVEPGNEYLMLTPKKGWPCLRKLWACSKEDLYNRWENIIGAYMNGVER